MNELNFNYSLNRKPKLVESNVKNYFYNKLKIIEDNKIKIDNIKYNENNYYTNLIILCYNYIKNYIIMIIKEYYGFIIFIILIVLLLYVRYYEIKQKKQKIKELLKNN